jgi:hypothetical protein
MAHANPNGHALWTKGMEFGDWPVDNRHDPATWPRQAPSLPRLAADPGGRGPAKGRARTGAPAHKIFIF